MKLNRRNLLAATGAASVVALAGTGPAIHALSLEELRRFDVGRLDPGSRYASQWPEQKPADGERIPTLEELFVLARASASQPRLNLEIKVTPTSGGTTPDPARFDRSLRFEFLPRD